MRQYSWKDAGFGLYIHWPFCQSKCPYCDFNSYVSREIDQDVWRTALLQSMARMAEITSGRTLKSIFFGGGTPSLMPVETVRALIDAAQKYWHFANDIEITLEANPTSVEIQRFQGYAYAGVNRVSLGVQALNDRDLQALGRMHTVAEALQAFEVARTCFKRVSFDLMYARMHQTPKEWEQELKTALSYAVDHLSMYQLTIEQGTRFGELYDRGKLRLPEDTASAEMYDITQELCEAAGLPAYEISNHAKDEGSQSRHNLIYWRYGEYAGIGPGAHSRLLVNGTRYAVETQRNPTQWLESAGECVNLEDVILPEEQATEYLMMSLRLIEGSCLKTYTQLGGVLNQQALKYLVEENFIEQHNQIIKSTRKGRIVLNSVLKELLI
jgi:oxygen-independent coproporphyrinogen-3 oxidase